MAKKKIDKRIKSYELNTGETRYMFKLYCGVDPTTGKKRKTTRRGFKTVAQASIELQRLELQVSQGEFQPMVKSKKFEEVYELWLPSYKQSVRESTWSSTIGIFKTHILPIFGEYYIDKIDVIMCQKHVNEWYDIRPKTFKKYLNYTKKVLSYAINLQLITSNPLEHVIIPKKIEEINSKRVTFYTKSELKEFLNAAKATSDFSYTFFHLLSYTGLRKGEALALKWSDINFKTKTLEVNRTLSRGQDNQLYFGPTKTKSGKRIISLDDSTIEILIKFRGNIIRQNDLIFQQDNSQPYNPSTVRHWIKPILAKCHLKSITPHGFRHTHASLLAEAGASLKEIQDRLGHADIQTTANIYTHVTENLRDNTAEKIAKLMA